MRLSPLFICLALAACGPRVPPVIEGDAEATAALRALPEAQFFAQSDLARQIADRCGGLDYNQRFATAVAEQRFGAELDARRAANRAALELEMDVGRRSLQARYGVDLDEADLCPVGEGELTRKSALSALLVSI